MLRETAVAAAVTAAVAFVPGVAGAATKHVDMGAPAAGAKQLQARGAEALAFFPTSVTIRVGDRIEFMPNGFHNVDLPRRGRGPAPFAVPGDAAASTDAGGAPFWFNGQPAFSFNPTLTRPKFGTRTSYTGARAVNSGLPLAPGRPKPFTVRFAKAGTFTYFCDLHPGMKGTVKVRGARASVPSAAADRLRVRRQVAAAVATAKKLQRTEPAPTTVLVGAAGAGGVESFAFYPAKKTVAVGTVLRFAMAQGSREAHTATTGPGNPLDERDTTSYLNVLASTFQGAQFDPRATYASDPPNAPPVGLTKRLHGNGFWNTGLLDASNPTPLPARGSVRFDEAGTYDFYCLLHPFMKGTVTAR